jgi:hypothetical protein
LRAFGRETARRQANLERPTTELGDLLAGRILDQNLRIRRHDRALHDVGRGRDGREGEGDNERARQYSLPHSASAHGRRRAHPCPLRHCNNESI